MEVGKLECEGRLTGFFQYFWLSEMRRLIGASGVNDEDGSAM